MHLQKNLAANLYKNQSIQMMRWSPNKLNHVNSNDKRIRPQLMFHPPRNSNASNDRLSDGNIQSQNQPQKEMNSQQNQSSYKTPIKKDLNQLNLHMDYQKQNQANQFINPSFSHHNQVSPQFARPKYSRNLFNNAQNQQQVPLDNSVFQNPFQNFNQNEASNMSFMVHNQNGLSNKEKENANPQDKSLFSKRGVEQKDKANSNPFVNSNNILQITSNLSQNGSTNNFKNILLENEQNKKQIIQRQPQNNSFNRNEFERPLILNPFSSNNWSIFSSANQNQYNRQQRCQNSNGYSQQIQAILIRNHFTALNLEKECQRIRKQNHKCPYDDSNFSPENFWKLKLSLQKEQTPFEKLMRENENKKSSFAWDNQQEKRYYRHLTPYHEPIVRFITSSSKYQQQSIHTIQPKSQNHYQQSSNQFLRSYRFQQKIKQDNRRQEYLRKKRKQQGQYPKLPPWMKNSLSTFEDTLPSRRKYNASNSSSKFKSQLASNFTNKHTRLNKLTSNFDPYVSEFTIDQNQLPFAKKYQVKIFSSENNIEGFWNNINAMAKKMFPGSNQKKEDKFQFVQQHTGQVRFKSQQYESTVHQAIIKDILIKSQLLKHASKKALRLPYYQFLDFNCFSNYTVNRPVKAQLLVPLKLKLPLNYGYHYKEYDGQTVKFLTIFNKFGQICFTEDIQFRQNCQSDRNLVGKIILNHNGVAVYQKKLKKKCQINLFRKLNGYLLENGNAHAKKLSQNRVIPLELNEDFELFGFDEVCPERIYGEIKNWNANKSLKYCRKVVVGLSKNIFLYLLILGIILSAALSLI